MASIAKDSNGRKRITFTEANGRQRAIRLGKFEMRDAEKVRSWVESLIVAKEKGISIDAETARWLAGVGDDMHIKLERVELVEPRERSRATVASLFEQVIALLAVKASTLPTYHQTKACIVAYFGQGRELSNITAKDAEEWQRAMKGSIALATVSKRTQIVKSAFRAAVRWKMIAVSPFEHLKAGSQANRERMHFVSRDDAARVLEACPDREWRLIVALSRFGGLRCTSEHFALQWEHVDWQRGRITIPSCKTQHHEHGRERQIPIFPELRPYLLDAFEQAAAGSTFVITKYRDPKANIRTQFGRIIRRAGLSVWARPFHNMRASCATELASTHPAHVAAAWLGHTVEVAREHYLQVRDSDFEKAAIKPHVTLVNGACKGVTESVTIGSRNASLRGAAGSGSDCQNDASRPENKPSTPECALARRVTPCSIKVGVGFEPTKNGFAIRPVGPLWHPTIH